MLRLPTLDRPISTILSHMPRNIKLIIEYDGTNYHGWQSQTGSGMQTVQETVEHAIREFGHEEASLYSSGRTDAGVHAFGHVANFATSKAMPPAAWAPALNHLLPPDIRVLRSEEVAPDFHARYSASGKTYKYVILNRDAPSALYGNRAWHLPKKLDLPAMRRAAKYILGTHDFSAFRASSCGAKNPVRTVRSLVISKEGEFVELWLTADAFLQHMARTIAGTLAQVGLGRLPSRVVKDILLSCDRTRAGSTAPARGLYLVQVYYRTR
jgi:tRNA pseudouridine38-40 synthase